jgi:aspartyl aminopeptidase
MPEKKSTGQKLADKILRKEKSAWERIGPGEREAVFNFCLDYRAFLDAAKTERECVAIIRKLAEERGYQPISALAGKKGLKPGQRIYAEWKEKAIALIVAGKEPPDKGIRIIGSHVDSPRLDLKPNPLYEDGGMALLKTHYYGGIKKYQWPSIPLALHGVVVTAEGNRVPIAIGEDQADPVFTITDLLPHLAKDQMAKRMPEAIPGEALNLIAGGIPVADEEIKEKVKLQVMDYLNREYGLVEEDFISAELSAVPAGGARDVGLDRSFLGGYGQDDRVCAYTAMRAIFDQKSPQHTIMALFVDKEEVGSTGNTGIQSKYFENTVLELCQLTNVPHHQWRTVMARSKALSADVNGGIDPNFEGVWDKRNNSWMGQGVVLTKYTGSGGKSNANDASAEYVGEIRQLFNRQKVAWQIGELGKVDQGGGGTIAHYMAVYGMDVVDCGPAILGMHSPFEVASKVDIYMTYRAYAAFFSG